jgi:tripartite-type tricarboxylate transporter receptor subunit TctC
MAANRGDAPVKHFALALLSAVGLAAPAAAQQAYPARPITMIVPFAAGGTSDVIARVIGEHMGKQLGQTIVNENVGGAGGVIALTRAANAQADGYTILIGNTGTNGASYVLSPDVKYTPDSFTPVGLIAKTAPVLAIRNDFPAKTLAEFVAYAKANPGKINLGHAGVGSSNYLICKNLVAAAQVQVTLVSYRGAAPALNDLLGGHVDGVCDAAPSVASSIQAGRVRGVALAARQRLEILPDLPTSAEAGLPAFQAEGWNAIFTPAKTPQAIIDRLNQALRASIADPAVKKRFNELGSTPAEEAEMTSEHVRNLVASDIAKYKVLLATKD